jgi:hypothetical protein
VRSAGIILTYKCNSRCRHCLYACGPEWRDWIDVEDGKRILEGMAASAGRVSGVHFAGGEAFLDFPKLFELVKYAVKLRMPVDYVETNAGWCVDDTTTRENLQALERAGLTCLLISASPFHAEYIPPERTLRGIKIAAEVFGPHGVIVWLPEFLRQITAIRTDGVIPFEEFVEKTGMGAVAQAAVYGGAMVPGGRAGFHLRDHQRLFPAERFFDDTCEDELLYSAHGHFDLYGHYIPASCTGIALKDARDLPAMIRDYNPEDHQIISILCKEGLGKLHELAAKRFGFQASSEGYAGKCHLCVDIRRCISQQTAEFDELAPSQYYQYL